MTQPLMDRKVLVTGAATGIGRAIALELASQGAQVAAADIQVPTQTVDAIRKAGGQAVGLAADVSQPDQVQNMVSSCVRSCGSSKATTEAARLARQTWPPAQNTLVPVC